MLLLVSTSDLIQVVTGSALNCDVHASYMDFNGSTVTPGRLNTQISTATTTTVVGSPGSGVQRNVKTLTIRNVDTANAQTITVQHFDGSITLTLVKVALQPKETLLYVDKFGFIILDNGGNLRIGPTDSKLLGVTLLTAASGTFTTQAATNFIMIRVQAGGGQGGGGLGGSSTASAGGGGGAGGYLEKTFAVAGNTGYAYTCGPGGSANTGNTTGANGTSSQFTVGSTTVTAVAGNGGALGGAAGSSILFAAGGNPSSQSSNGDVNGAGSPGGAGIRLSGTIAMSGQGGSSLFGSGGNGVSTDVAGNPATGFGAGGGGACSLSAVARNGGAGANGCIVVEEYT